VVLGVLLTLSDLGITPALIHKDHVGRRDYVAGWSMEIVRALTISGILFASAPMIADIFGEPRSTNIIRALALRPLFAALASTQLAQLNRNLDFRTIAFLKVPAAVLDLAVAVSLAETLGVWAMVIGVLFGEALTVILAFTMKPWRPGFSLNLQDIRPLLNYGRWILLTGMVALAGGTVLQAVIARQLGAAELGMFYLALQLANLPSEVTDQVVNPVAFPLYSRLRTSQQRLLRAFRSIFVGMSAVLLPSYALLLALAPSLTTNILGENWAGTAPVIQVLALAAIVSILSDAVAPLLNGVGQPHKVTVLESVQSAMVIIFVWYLAPTFGVVGAAGALLPAMLVSQVISGLFLGRIIDKPSKHLLGPLLAVASAAVVGALIASALDRIGAGIVGFIFAAVAGIAVILSLLWFFDRRFQFGIRDDILRAFPQLRALLPSTGGSGL